jgi:hypothetical protein
MHPGIATGFSRCSEGSQRVFSAPQDNFVSDSSRACVKDGPAPQAPPAQKGRGKEGRWKGTRSTRFPAGGQDAGARELEFAGRNEGLGIFLRVRRADLEADERKDQGCIAKKTGQMKALVNWAGMIGAREKWSSGGGGARGRLRKSRRAVSMICTSRQEDERLLTVSVVALSQ